MDNVALIESFKEFAKEKNIDRPTLMSVIEYVFKAMIKKQYGEDENFNIIVNVDKGDLEIWRQREIVPDDKIDINPIKEIPLSEAQKTEPDFEAGETFSEAVHLLDFGRRSIQTSRQTLLQKIKDIEKNALYQRYKDQINELVVGEVYQVRPKEVLVVDGEGNELILPKSEQISKDKYKKGDIIRGVVLKVDVSNNIPQIVISRTSNAFLERLFELEVPEIYDGLISIKKIIREPGERAKVAVESYDDRIDPVGACVGMKGTRIHGIVRELRNENIDIISYTTNNQLYITRALSPAKIINMNIDEDNKRVSVFLKPDQLALAIGKGGQNIKLASKLTGYEIDVYRENEEPDVEDVKLEDFSDEIEEWTIEELKKIGLDTAKSVLALSKDELIRRTDLEEETITEILQILQKEFEK